MCPPLRLLRLQDQRLLGSQLRAGQPALGASRTEEEEFFAQRAPDVVSGGTGAERKRRIEGLQKTRPELY